MAKLTVPVLFGSSSSKSSIAVTINRSEKMDPEKADEVFCHKRLRVTLKGANKNGDDAKQKRIPGTTVPEFEGYTDVKGFRAVRDAFGIRLKFEDDHETAKTLCDLADKPGNLIVHSIEDIPETPKAGADAVDGDQKTAFDDDDTDD